MTIKDLVRQAHQTATEKGFWDQQRDSAVYVALMMTELAEMIEEQRAGTEAWYIEHNSGKPCGELSELADVVIRAADYAGSKGWDLQSAIEDKMAFNKTRAPKHGKRF